MEKMTSILENLKKNRTEVVLIVIASVTVLCSALLYIVNSRIPESGPKPTVIRKKPLIQTTKTIDTIVVDVSGSVMKPDSYQLQPHSRLKDAIDKAQGLSELADKDFFYRNYNLSRILVDQEKIYIPSLSETSLGLYTENHRVVDFTGSTLTEPQEESNISINTASIAILDTLPSIAKTAAEKIITNRPYVELDELVSKKILTTSVFNKIKDLIQL